LRQIYQTDYQHFKLSKSNNFSNRQTFSENALTAIYEILKFSISEKTIQQKKLETHYQNGTSYHYDTIYQIDYQYFNLSKRNNISKQQTFSENTLTAIFKMLKFSIY
jgi:hypothetical protein